MKTKLEKMGFTYTFPTDEEKEDGLWHLSNSNIYIQDTLRDTGYYSVFRDDTDLDGSVTYLAETKTLKEAMDTAKVEAAQ